MILKKVIFEGQDRHERFFPGGSRPTISIIYSNHENDEDLYATESIPGIKLRYNFNKAPMAVSRATRASYISALQQVGLLLQVRPAWNEDFRSSGGHALGWEVDLPDLLGDAYLNCVHCYQINIPPLAKNVGSGTTKLEHSVFRPSLFANLKAVYLNGTDLHPTSACTVANASAAIETVKSNWLEYDLPIKAFQESQNGAPAALPVIYINTKLKFNVAANDAQNPSGDGETSILPQRANEEDPVLFKLIPPEPPESTTQTSETAEAQPQEGETVETGTDGTEQRNWTTSWHCSTASLNHLEANDPVWSVFTNAPDFDEEEPDHIYKFTATHKGQEVVTEVMSTDNVEEECYAFAATFGKYGSEEPYDFDWDGDRYPGFLPNSKGETFWEVFGEETEISVWVTDIEREDGGEDEEGDEEGVDDEGGDEEDEE